MSAGNPPRLEQAGAVRDLYSAATESQGVASELIAEVEDHGRLALLFLRAWADDAEADPSEVRESFARVEVLYRLLGGLVDQQRRAMGALPARLAPLPGADPDRASQERGEVIDELRRQGALPHRARSSQGERGKAA